MGETGIFRRCNIPPDWHGKHARYYWKIQRNLHERFGVVPRYIRQPGVYDFYESVQNKEVLFASPLAQLVREQAASGRLQKLYKTLKCRCFRCALSGLDIYMANRPHSSWSDTLDACRKRSNRISCKAF